MASGFDDDLDGAGVTGGRDRRLLFGSRDAVALPLIVRHADVLAEMSSDDEVEVGLSALLTGFRALTESGPGAGTSWTVSGRR